MAVHHRQQHDGTAGAARSACALRCGFTPGRMPSHAYKAQSVDGAHSCTGSESEAHGKSGPLASHTDADMRARSDDCMDVICQRGEYTERPLPQASWLLISCQPGRRSQVVSLPPCQCPATRDAAAKTCWNRLKAACDAEPCTQPMRSKPAAAMRQSPASPCFKDAGPAHSGGLREYFCLTATTCSLRRL